MIELVPYMLMLAWAAPCQPGGVEIERVAEVFASQQACEAAAAAHVAATRRSAVTHKCLALPSREEFDRLFAELDAREARK